MKSIIAFAIISGAFATTGLASAACPESAPNAVTSKAPADAKAAADPQAAENAKGIAEDGQHTPLETDPNAPGVTVAQGGVTTNTDQAEAEIVAGTKTDAGTTASTSETDKAAADLQDPACTN